MFALRVALLSCVLAITFQEIRGHGMLLQPVARSSAWRNGFPVPPNYTDNELFCGGFGSVYYGVDRETYFDVRPLDDTRNCAVIEPLTVGNPNQYEKNHGNCGVCGDDWSLPRPRPNENGGIYGTGIIVGKYQANSRFEIEVKLTAAHLGHFEFSICPLNRPNELETDECFANYPVQLADGSYEYRIEKFEPRVYRIQAILPRGLTCDHCVLRWHYKTGNRWGTCDDGREALGCGDQEVFRGCADISITQ